MSSLDTKIPASIESVEVRRMEGRYPMEIRAFRNLGKNTLIIGSAALLHLYRAVTEGRVQTTSFITVAGNCITNPCNLEVTIGTSVDQVLERCGLSREPSCLIEGGAMHGILIQNPLHTMCVQLPVPSWLSTLTVRNSFTTALDAAAASKHVLPA